MSRIARVEVSPLSVPMPRPWVPEAPQLHLVSVRVTDEDGATGTGFSWTPTIGRTAVAALLHDDIADFAVGRTTDAAQLWPALWTHLHEAGGGGVTTIAMAGLDLALWDLALTRAGRGLVETLGRRHDSLPVYGSGVNLHYTDDELAAQVRRWVDRGIRAVKIKVGRPDIADDVRRVGLVREILGADGELMIDANQRWTLPRAVEAMARLEEFAPAWIEEPLRADDLSGYRELAARLSTPIACGENLHTVHRFRDFLEAGAVRTVQPNVIRVGGITPFLEIAALADGYGVDVAPHLLPDLSAQLAMTRLPVTWVEDVEDAGFDRLGVLAADSPVTIDGAVATVSDIAGLGLGLRSDASEREVA